MTDRPKLYVCDVVDSTCDIGEHYVDARVYRTREAAERRAERLTDEGGFIQTWASVMEMEQCWEEDV